VIDFFIFCEKKLEKEMNEKKSDEQRSGTRCQKSLATLSRHKAG
jgi:hypothetical protein